MQHLTQVGGGIRQIKRYFHKKNKAGFKSLKKKCIPYKNSEILKEK